MQEIGIVKFVQIQQESLKENMADGTRKYNPTPLLQLPKIKLTTDGVIGLTENDNEIIDVHHVRHPNSRYRGDNPISIGFTSHYTKMRSEIGHHLSDGIAGESIIIDCHPIYTVDTISNRIAIKNKNDGSFIYLKEIIPIPPCEPFSRFARAKKLTPSETKSTLQFLSGGMRGFYMKLENTPDNTVIQAGDSIYIVTD
jgi:hypothetical protein